MVQRVALCCGLWYCSVLRCPARQTLFPSRHQSMTIAVSRILWHALSPEYDLTAVWSYMTLIRLGFRVMRQQPDRRQVIIQDSAHATECGLQRWSWTGVSKGTIFSRSGTAKSCSTNDRSVATHPTMSGCTSTSEGTPTNAAVPKDARNSQWSSGLIVSIRHHMTEKNLRTICHLETSMIMLHRGSML